MKKKAKPPLVLSQEQLESMTDEELDRLLEQDLKDRCTAWNLPPEVAEEVTRSMKEIMDGLCDILCDMDPIEDDEQG